MKEFRLYQDLADYEREDENSVSVGNVLDLESYDSSNCIKLLESPCFVCSPIFRFVERGRGVTLLRIDF